MQVVVLQSNCHQQQTNAQIFTVLSPNQQRHSTERKSYEGKIFFLVCR